MPAGRPTKFKPEYCQALIEYMKEGRSYETFGCTINVNTDTLYNWERLFPEFSEAKKVAMQYSRRWWEDVGRAGATGKLPGFNAAAFIFTMKNRFKWADVQKVEVTESQDEEVKELMEDLKSALKRKADVRKK